MDVSNVSNASKSGTHIEISTIYKKLTDWWPAALLCDS